MKLASELLTASREELIAYLKAWQVKYRATASDIELRLAAHKNFQKEGPGDGPIPAIKDADQGNTETSERLSA